MCHLYQHTNKLLVEHIFSEIKINEDNDRHHKFIYLV